MRRTLDFSDLEQRVRKLRSCRISGRIHSVGEALVDVEGLSRVVRLGDRVQLMGHNGHFVGAEAVSLEQGHTFVLPEGRTEGFAIGDRAQYLGQSEIAPEPGWLGHILNAFGDRLDGGPLGAGKRLYALRKSPPDATRRRTLGPRLNTGLSVFNTFLPIVRGQRLGIFAGSGVGKTTLLGKLLRTVEADAVVLVLIGERGREVGDFVHRILGPDAMKRCVVVVATSDQSPAIKRRAAFTGMAIAEFLRDEGAHVLFAADSITRFAEAHRDVAAATGELPTVRGFPPSTSRLVIELSERAGPGTEGMGDITALFSVLVAGSDFEEPLADLLRGVLDGHVILDRSIAARGRFPAVDVLNSASRSLPDAATSAENEMLSQARRLIALYDRSKVMIDAGLYSEGNDPNLDRAILAHDALEAFLGRVEMQSIESSFKRLSKILA
ncbi:MAG: FliI/YscN family ATPase [Pseudomonadota bacterium]